MKKTRKGRLRRQCNDRAELDDVRVKGRENLVKSVKVKMIKKKNVSMSERDWR